ncbi:MAG: PIN domain-containing protein [Acidobacteria bacterium]|nr:PIN domain-containing protein [Acidobacteriota bacterium]
MLAVVDTGPLYAVVDEDDADHARCREALEQTEHRLIIPTLVVAEVTYLIGTRLGPDVEAQFLKGLARMHVEAPTADDWPRIADLVEQYGDFPLGGADASIVALAERLDIETIVTLDDRHFRAVRPRHRKAFRLLP